MSFISFDVLPPWAGHLSLAAHLAAGVALGFIYFKSLWWNACRFTGGGRATTAIAFTVGRLALLGGLLTLASLEGALPLLMVALGVFIARPVVMRSVRWAVP
jgi:F1F0 ATPase subunit 2